MPRTYCIFKKYFMYLMLTYQVKLWITVNPFCIINIKNTTSFLHPIGLWRLLLFYIAHGDGQELTQMHVSHYFWMIRENASLTPVTRTFFIGDAIMDVCDELDQSVFSLSIHLQLSGSQVKLECIPVIWGWACTLDKSPVFHRDTQADTQPATIMPCFLPPKLFFFFTFLQEKLSHIRHKEMVKAWA